MGKLRVTTSGNVVAFDISVDNVSSVSSVVSNLPNSGHGLNQSALTFLKHYEQLRICHQKIVCVCKQFRLRGFKGIGRCDMCSEFFCEDTCGFVCHFEVRDHNRPRILRMLCINCLNNSKCKKCSLKFNINNKDSVDVCNQCKRLFCHTCLGANFQFCSECVN